MFIVTKKLKTFSAAHRLVKHYQGPCQYLHGHNYTVEVTLSADVLNKFDMVVDFNVIKIHFDQWVQDHWDHVTLVSEIDVDLMQFLIKGQQRYFLIPERNTTVECLAEFLFHRFSLILKHLNQSNVVLKSVCVFESEASSAVYKK